MNTREKVTVSKMIRIYCRSKHGGKKMLCADCKQLGDYALERLERCPFGDNKPACNTCSVHCYQPQYREKIREVMRFSGPRMIFRYPIDAVRHFRQVFGRKYPKK